MLPKNVIMMREHERQNRIRLQMEAENARNLAGITDKKVKNITIPAWQLTLRKVRALRMRLNPTG